MIKEWLKNTYRAKQFKGVTIQDIREKITCSDGFEMSVQASSFHYCQPRKNLPNGEYQEVEIGFPSAEEELISAYAEYPDKLTKTVYGYVPIDIVEKVIEKHGGVAKEEP